MKRLCDLVLLLLALCLLGSLLGCSSKGKTEAEIRADIPSDFLTLQTRTYLDSVVDVGGLRDVYSEACDIPMEITGFEVEKRQTDEESDLVYCNLTLEGGKLWEETGFQEDYELKVSCLLRYGYYDKGGWILDECSVLDGQYELTPKFELSKELAAGVLEGHTGFQGNEGTLVSQSWDSSRTVLTCCYDIAAERAYCDIQGKLDIGCTVTGQLWTEGDGLTANTVVATLTYNAEELMYDAQCQWHINGSWHWEESAYNTVVNLTIRQNGNGLDVEGSWVNNMTAQFGSCWVALPTDSAEYPTSGPELSFRLEFDHGAQRTFAIRGDEVQIAGIYEYFGQYEYETMSPYQT